MLKMAKDFYSKNKQWLQWIGVSGMPLFWACIFLWVYFGTGGLRQREWLQGWMESKFTIDKFIISVALLAITMVLWKAKPTSFLHFLMKFAAGSLLSVIIGVEIALAIWNYSINFNSDSILFAVVGGLTWIIFFGIIFIINKQKP